MPSFLLKEPLVNEVGQVDGEGSRVQITSKISCKHVALVGGVIVVLLAVWQKDAVAAGVANLWGQLKSLGYGACPVVCVLCWLLTAVSGPAFLVEVAAGALFQSMFGMNPGAFVAMLTCGIGIWLGCITAFFLGQRYLKKHVKEVIERHEMLAMVNEIIAEEGWKFAFLMRLNPLIPFELFNYAVAMTDIHPVHNAIAALGTMPIVCFEVYGAASATAVAASAAAAHKQHGDSTKNHEEIEAILIKLLISSILIFAVGLYGKRKYDLKVREKARQHVCKQKEEDKDAPVASAFRSSVSLHSEAMTMTMSRRISQETLKEGKGTCVIS